MVLKVSEVSGSLDRYHGDFEGTEGLLRASFPNFGESLVGGMTFRSKRSTVCADAQPSPCGSTLSVSSMLSTSPSKPSVMSASSVSSKPIPIVLQKRHGPYTERGSFHAWIDAMRAQSPPHVHSLHEDIPDAFDLEDAVYKSWLEEHPSALRSFDTVVKHSHEKHVVVFLDYDGTLSPIVEDPERAFMSAEMRATVKELASCFPTAVISGRSRPKVYEFVQLSELYYAGSHGMDIMGPANNADGFRVKGTKSRDKKGNDVVLFQPASDYLELINKACNALIETTKLIKGAKVEHNKFCVTVHFRRVKEEHWEALAERVGNVMKDFPTLILTNGRKVLEVRPSIAWDKGKAVDFLLKSLGYNDSSDILPIYIGDDKTDEDAFRLNMTVITRRSTSQSTVAAFWYLLFPNQPMPNCLFRIHPRLRSFCIGSCTGRSGDWKAETAFRRASTTTKMPYLHRIIYSKPAPNLLWIQPTILVPMTSTPLTLFSEYHL